MEFRDSLESVFSCSKIHCYLLPIFVYPITVRLDKFGPPKFRNTPFIPIGVTAELGTAESSLLLADY